ncbi:MAG: hypothetical protein COU31_03440 [Candidatus Magasanikbacteria bacterium CG10_big_fil_rev_8_21_14_0_10_40_10]|uniref:Uncharacterized protein n=2 Tax=Parcubacteria group TaxID=1794811 RepID=A0A2H0YTS0_9BACT|nr:MAG: hypothetical protein COT25_00685 [Candidatus Kerfeldbacteria bacterium CG08_land_8_20_14_0_20_42_7]PIT87341.1 MAG: hypothetical protein COU31_03440 [Candidatus Magasanikbacteria bacterium CG10_big_fil_rev_8_21_14_0_10_40_10]
MVFWYSLFFEEELKRFIEIRNNMIQFPGYKLENSLQYYKPEKENGSTLGGLITKVNRLYAENKKILSLVKKIEEFNSVRKKVVHNFL